METVLKNIEKHDDDTNRRAIDALVSKLKRDKKMDFLSRLCEIIYEKKFSSEKIEISVGTI